MKHSHAAAGSAPHPKAGQAMTGAEIIVQVLADAHSRLLVHDLEGKLRHEVELPTLGTVRGTTRLFGRGINTALRAVTPAAAPPMLMCTRLWRC